MAEKEKLYSILSEAYKNTKEYFDWKQRKAVISVCALLGFALQYIISGSEAVMDELIVRISYGLLPLTGLVMWIFFWDIIKVPVRQIDKRQGIMIVGFVVILSVIIHLLPFGKFDIRQYFTNKEKEEVKLIINSTINEIELLLRQKEMIVQVLKINKVKIADTFNKYEVSFYESVKLKALIENKIFQKELPKISITLLGLQRSLKEVLEILNNKNDKSITRAIAIMPYLVTLDIIQEQLKLCIRFIDNEITRQELTEKINDMTREKMEKLTKSGNLGIYPLSD